MLFFSVLGLEASSSSTNATGDRKGDNMRAWKNPRILDNDNDSMDDGESDSRSLSHIGNKQEKHNSSSWDYDGKDLQTSTSSTSNMGPMGSSDLKKSRPKRGKYRNYDRDALLKGTFFKII